MGASPADPEVRIVRLNGDYMKQPRIFVLLATLLALSTVLPLAAYERGMPVTGTIKTIGEKNLTIETHDQKEVEVIIDEKTKFEKNGKPATAKDLKAGVRVVVDVDKNQAKEALVAKEVRIGAESVIYTCPMHSEVQEKEPGKCPKCGMKLELKP
jgi:rubrerythrin